MSSVEWRHQHPVQGQLSQFMRVSGKKRRLQASEGYSGYLVKKGQLVKSWKRRFFSLSYGVLEYFEDEKAFETHKKNGSVYDSGGMDRDRMAPFRPKGGLTLAGADITNVNEHELTFEIHTSDRVLHVQAETSASLLGWRRNLHLNIDLANEDSICMGEKNQGVINWVKKIGDIAFEAETRLKEGVMFKKFCRSRFWGRVKGHPRHFKLSDDAQSLCWFKVGKNGELKKDSKKFVNMKEVGFVEGGLGAINAMVRVNSLSLVFGNALREIVVEACNERERESFLADVWAIQYFTGLKACQKSLVDELQKQNTQTERKKLSNLLHHHPDM